jgi:predicted lactoylglutathione lyase
VILNEIRTAKSAVLNDALLPEKGTSAAGHRPQYGNGFHSAYVRDPDGNKLAFVYYASAV